jgi:hypothetical protein
MKFEDIQSLLGQETITGFQSTIASVLESAGGDHDTVCALRELLVSMLAAIVTTTTYLQQSEQLAAEDATQLIALVRKTKEITPRQQPVAPPLALTPVAAEVLMLSVRGAEQGATQRFVPSAEPSRIMAQLAGRDAHEPAGTTDSHKVIPFRAKARRPESGASEVAPVAGCELMVHALCASRSAIARKKELTAQKREVLAQSRALLARSRSLRESLGALHLGRHS